MNIQDLGEFNNNNKQYKKKKSKIKKQREKKREKKFGNFFHFLSFFLKIFCLKEKTEDSQFTQILLKKKMWDS